MAKWKHFVVQKIVQQARDIVIVKFVDPKLFDMLIVTELQDELMDFIDTEKPTRVVIDFTTVTHCSTSVINSLLRAKKRLLTNQGKLKLAGMSPTIREAYKMLNLDGTVFEIYDKPSDGLDGFASE